MAPKANEMAAINAEMALKMWHNINVSV